MKNLTLLTLFLLSSLAVAQENTRNLNFEQTDSSTFTNWTTFGNEEYTFTADRENVQEGNSSLMLYSIDEIISYVSKFITLKTGDIIFTGTPKGVGPIKIGDRLTGFIENEEMFSFEIK